MTHLFFHLEDANGDAGLDDRAPGTLDESETATAEIADLRQEEADIVEAEGEAERLEDDVETAEDLTEIVEPVVTEGRGLDKAGISILLTGMRAIAGRNYAHIVGKNIRMEAIDSGASGRAEQTKIVFEDLKDTLKSAWEAIKAAFKKAWAKIKTWYVKTFDSSKKLKKRAENIRTKAENTNATIDKKTFSFSGAKSLATDGSLKDGGKLVTGLGTIKKLAGDILNTVHSDKVGTTAEKIADKLGEVNEAGLDSALTTIYQEAHDHAALKGLSGSVGDSKVAASLGDSKEVQLLASSELPGGKLIVAVKGKSTSTGIADRIAAVRRTRTVFVNSKDKPKEVATEVGTLTTSQVGNLCDVVIEIADYIFDFKKGWENRDRDQDKLIKAIDDAFKDVSKENNDDVTSAGRRNARGLASAATGLLRRDSAFKSTFVGYALSTCNLALSYAEGSLRQHKK